MTDKSRFGKCDECGVMGILNVVPLSESGLAANFCPSCHRIFQDRPDLSSFIAFERGKPNGEHAHPSEAGMAIGHDERVSIPETRKEQYLTIGEIGEARNPTEDPPNSPR